MPAWLLSHKNSENYAEKAHDALKQGEENLAKELFKNAAMAETEALDALDESTPRTLGIIAVSSVALWYKSGSLKKAEQMAHQASIKEGMPLFAIAELRELLQTIWNEQAQKEADISFVPGQVIVSVKGGDVVVGGAPLDLIIEKVQLVEKFFYRTAEYLQDLPLRKKGPPLQDIQNLCRPWLFQSVPGSYQFAVAIQKPRQRSLFPQEGPTPNILIEKFLLILRTAGEDPENSLTNIIRQEEYRETFLKMTRNLAPTGKSFSQLEIRGANDSKPIILSPDSRKIIQEALRSTKTESSEALEPEESLQGTLRALNLDRDWLEITQNAEHTRVTGVGEAVDDLIGPMVNQRVKVRVRKNQEGKLKFIDIEREE